MKEILDEFLLSLEARGRAERTLGAYAERVGAVLAFLAERGIQDIDAVQASDLDRFVVSQRRRGLSSVTIADHVQALKAFFAWCVRRGYLAGSPADHLVKPKLERGGRSPVMARADLAALIGAAEEGKPRDLAVLLFLADTGCRVGEVVALTRLDVNLAHREAIVRGKTGARVVDFTERTAEALEALNVSRNGAGSVFGMTGNAVRKMLQRLAGRAGVTGRVNPHSIRHLVGQAWLDDGANLELVRQKLGHADIQVTAMFYAHQDRARVKAATERFSLVNG
jgi:integrase/recombinase XerD